MTGLEFVRYYNKYFEGVSDRLTPMEIDNMIEIMYESIMDAEGSKLKIDRDKNIEGCMILLNKVDKQRAEIEDFFVSRADDIAEKIMTDSAYSTELFADYPKLIQELKNRGL